MGIPLWRARAVASGPPALEVGQTYGINVHVTGLRTRPRARRTRSPDCSSTGTTDPPQRRRTATLGVTARPRLVPRARLLAPVTVQAVAFRAVGCCPRDRW